MDFTPKRRRVVAKQEVNPLLEAYPHDLQMYKVPPTGEISLVEFQNLSLERQKILQLLDIAQAQQAKSLDDLKKSFVSTLKKEGFIHYAKLLNAPGCASHTDSELESRRKDHISHFVLRLAYSLKDELQMYFINHESELFKLRFSSLNKEGLAQFLATSGLHYSKISPEFKEENRDELYSSTARDLGDFENTDFYELPFDEVVDLVSDRRVFLNKGVAYVPQSDLMTVFLAHFRSNLAVELNRAKKFVLSNLDDERLQVFLKSLPECYSGMSKVVWNSENVPIAKLDDLAKTSYPLCMRIMHDHLKTSHHLKNSGRLEYGLFLKGIGVTLEDSIEFWRTEMTKKEDTNEDKFNKQYLYHINYNYGKVGRRVNYRPLGCNKLITESAGPGDVHGCPFKHMDSDCLTKKLMELKINTSDIGEITKLASEHHYNLACSKYFASTHKQMPGRVLLHPNQYFQESREILSKEEIKEEDNMTQEIHTPASPEKILQPIKVKVENDLDIGNSPKLITPKRSTERKARVSEKKTGPLNIEALLNEDSD